MTPRTPFLVALAALTLGCTTTRFVGTPVTPASVEAIGHENPGTAITIERLVVDGGSTAIPVRRRLTLVETTPGQTIVKVEGVATELTVANADIRSLRVSRHARGALQGAGVGALIAGGLMATVALSPCSGNCNGELSRGEAVTAVGVLLGLPVVLLSTAVGALAGAHTSYVFDEGNATY